MLPISDTKTSGHFPVMTIGLILINCVVFFYQLSDPTGNYLVHLYGFLPNAFPGNEEAWKTLFTSQFLHGGFFHLLTNMLFLWVFGDNVEERLGWLYLPFYLLAGVSGALLHYLLDPNGSIPLIGASGAIAGVLGAYALLYPHHRVKTLIILIFFITFVTLPAWLLLLYWFALQVFSGLSSISSAETGGGTAYLAHVGGFIFGAVVALFIKATGSRDSSELS
ncbi:MAG: Rhomboid family protein [Patescibacteria group bacterium]|jgi:membrane associated rhomboid family serine protease|nr:Rhomboid family protein [Patescibacteria group bacterium]